MDYVGIAAAMLAEVGLSFDDVLDIGRSWVIGPPGLQMQIAEPAYRGTCSYRSIDNPTSRQRALISLTGPVDCDWMLYILAHECGHVKQGGWTSIPVYILEYQAEIYAIDAFQRHCGRPLPADIIEDAKEHVLAHVIDRFQQFGWHPTKGWDFQVMRWCQFNPPAPESGE